MSQRDRTKARTGSYTGQVARRQGSTKKAERLTGERACRGIYATQHTAAISEATQRHATATTPKRATASAKKLPKKEKPLSKRMARERLIPPSRRSARMPPETLAPRKGSALNDDTDTGDKNVTWSPCFRPPRLMRVPQLKEEGSPYKCCVWGCRAAGSEPFTGIWLFALPADKTLKSAWCESIPIDFENNRPRSPRLCFEHFKKEDFVLFKDRPIGLVDNAVPVYMANKKLG